MKVTRQQKMLEATKGVYLRRSVLKLCIYFMVLKCGGQYNDIF
jgi:hypothetical protein